MNRKIFTITPEGFGNVLIEQKEYSKGFGYSESFDYSEGFAVYGRVSYAMEGKTFEVAVRPISNSKRIIFTIGHDLIGNEVFFGIYKSNSLYLCIEKMQQVFGVGYKTKRFSLWVRPVA